MNPISWLGKVKCPARLQTALNNIEFGACELLVSVPIFDGLSHRLIRVCSFGLLETDLLPMQYLRVPICDWLSHGASRRFLKSLK